MGLQHASASETTIVVRSELGASAAEVWAAISTMDGVNGELAPWVRMTVPGGARGQRLEDAPLGRVAFSSWLLFLGVWPFDRHTLTLVAIDPGRSFDELSHSWLQRSWRHERTVEPSARGCTVTDRLMPVPRVAALAPVVRGVVRRLFEHRHARLLRRFGPVAGPERAAYVPAASGV